MKVILPLLILALLIGWFIANMGKAPHQPVTEPPEKYEPLIISWLVADANAETVNPVSSPREARSMGSDDAPITLYVFSSLVCGHCAHFHTDVLPQIEEMYVDNGRVKMIYIDLPPNRNAMAGAMIARCVKPENYFKFLQVLFDNQSAWAFGNEAEQKLSLYAELQGMSKGQIKACLSDRELMQSITSARDTYIKKFNLRVTPSVVVVRGDKHELVQGDNLAKIADAINRME